MIAPTRVELAAAAQLLAEEVAAYTDPVARDIIASQYTIAAAYKELRAAQYDPETRCRLARARLEAYATWRDGTS